MDAILINSENIRKNHFCGLVFALNDKLSLKRLHTYRSLTTMMVKIILDL